MRDVPYVPATLSNVSAVMHLHSDMLLLPEGTFNDQSAMFLRRPVMKWCKEHLRQWKAGRESVDVTCTAQVKIRRPHLRQEVGDQWHSQLHLPIIRFDHPGDQVLFKLMWGGA